MARGRARYFGQGSQLSGFCCDAAEGRVMSTPETGVQLSTAGNTGTELYSLVTELYPICRSITGDGVRDTLRRVQQRMPLAIHEVPSGTHVFDWTVPREWNIREAW